MSSMKIILMSAISAVIGGLIVGMLLVMSISPSNSIFTQPSPKYVPGTGYRMLANFQCRFGEQKHILMRGADDDFSLGNPEPSRRIPGLEDYPGYVTNYPYLRDYDEIGPDKIFSDYFDVIPNISRGLFVLRLGDIETYGNDTISIGDFLDLNENYEPKNNHVFNAILKNLVTSPGWQSSPEGVISARLKDIKFQTISEASTPVKVDRVYATLLRYLQSNNPDDLMGVVIDDDTAVDYMGLALCTTPKEKMGVTFTDFKPLRRHQANLQLFSCELEFKSERCNPFVGDRVCNSELPLACVKDMAAPVPEINDRVPERLRNLVEMYWGAVDVEFTPPVRGDAFQTLADANAFCRAQLGASWRVMDFHDGGTKGVASLRSSSVPDDRVWIDIKDQPKGTCWAREDSTQRGISEALK